MSRNRIIIAIVLVIVGVIVTSPLWTPYFREDVVDEAFPGLTDAQRDGIREMPEEQRDTLIAMVDENAEMAEDTAVSQLEDPVTVPEDEQAMPENMPDEPVILGMGSFVEIDVVHSAEGSATFYEVDGETVVRFEDFRSTNGPQLHVYLSKDPMPTLLGGIGEGAIDLGPLKGNVGNQNYFVPEDVDISEYNSVVIYCVPFNVVFSYATYNDTVG